MSKEYNSKMLEECTSEAIQGRVNVLFKDGNSESEEGERRDKKMSERRYCGRIHYENGYAVDIYEENGIYWSLPVITLKALNRLSRLEIKNG